MLAGRDAERARIAALLDGARGGTGGALVVRGVAGAGKSTVLTEAVDAAADMRVLRTSGVESESPLAFAALQRLLWPVRSLLAGLPAPQQAALGAALGEAAGEGERFLAFLGTLSLLADAAEDSPVLAVVDDAHWLDDASAAALLFVARRLQAERVALLFAARDGDALRFDAPDLPAVVLGGLTGADAEVVLAARAGGAVDPAVRDQLVEATGGNPLALGELSEVLTADQLAGRAPLPTPLPLTGGVERAFLDRYRRLGEAARRFLLVAAADDTARSAVVRAAAEHLGVGDDALDEAERAGLLRVDGSVVSLYHPLVRSAVYRAATSAQRRATHRALAEVSGADPDRRAWHLAAAADRPDDTVVAALDAVAERAAGRGGHEAAAAAWARAAELTAGGEARGRRLYLAAASQWLGAHPARAVALAAAAAADVSDPRTRAQLLVLRGQVESHTRSLDDGFDLVLQATEVAAGVDPAMASSLAMVAAAFSAFGARSPRRLDPSALVPSPALEAPAAVRTASALQRGFSAVARREWAVAAECFADAFAVADDEPAEDQHALQPNLGLAAILIGDDERGLRLHAQHLTTARRAGALNWVEHALTRGVLPQVATGAWTQAAAAAAEALPLAASTGHAAMTALPTVELALLAALRGDAAAEEHLAHAAAVRQAHPAGVTDTLVLDLLHWARGLHAARQPATALHHLEQIGAPWVRRLAAIDALETAVRADRADVARAWLAELTAFAAGTGAPAAVAVVEHGHALLAGGDRAEEHFRRALAVHASSPRLPDRARTELAFGEHLRRARRRVDAREHLRTALALFEELGATPWAERAAQELRASGETARRRDVSTATELTPQERQVTALVRQGLSNRDVAAQLFVSPRTVDFHLRNVFTKLGVASRAELTALPLS
ncbi:regulatory LuxR family protein [Geodermatophilus tzadiensis]|uniref:Regulatory LuxR family protein n=1 Tax=Geodermatophilus tzadiensis TaxID=1137988 RepID=A0A2T0U1U1_9ACTN|nr:helix-turn-helix transcriptional regulator [Geodermatophilus tzadiensis]PRY51891.1 regulatory LuxR family protein [Geodermatophilus tzadiensis]